MAMEIPIFNIIIMKKQNKTKQNKTKQIDLLSAWGG